MSNVITLPKDLWTLKNQMVFLWNHMPLEERIHFKREYPWFARTLDDFTYFTPEDSILKIDEANHS